MWRAEGREFQIVESKMLKLRAPNQVTQSHVSVYTNMIARRNLMQKMNVVNSTMWQFL